MKKEEQTLRKTIHHLLWHMRGGLTRDDGWTLSPKERTELEEDIKTRVETVEKTGLPLL